VAHQARTGRTRNTGPAVALISDPDRISARHFILLSVLGSNVFDHGLTTDGNSHITAKEGKLKNSQHCSCLKEEEINIIQSRCCHQ